jgi:oligopeptide/dipeptide ABC transporter ATP-binding protein
MDRHEEPLEALEALPAHLDAAGNSNAPLLAVQGLSVQFTTDDGPLQAVDDVSFTVDEHQTLAIVGESGSGKTVTSLAVLGLLPKTATVTGSIRFRGIELVGRKEREYEKIRGRRIAMVFQDALAALNPVYTVGDQIAEAISTHHPDVGKVELNDRVVELLDVVGIANPRERAALYPHEFSGGMRQRAMIAMSIANDPDLLIADEPTTALDVTIQAQVLEVLERIQQRTRSSILLITHDLGVVAGVAQQVMVMYAGRQVELGGVDDIFYAPRHPYTLGLLASLPRIDRRRAGTQLHRIKGQPPSLVYIPRGCAFHPRCEFAALPDPCASEKPALREITPGHHSACHLAEGLAGLTPESIRERVS